MKIDTSKLDYVLPASFVASGLYVYTGPMNVAKSKTAIDIHYNLNEQNQKAGVPIYVAKPDVDKRDNEEGGGAIRSRAYPGFKLPAAIYRVSHPTDLFTIVNKERPGYVLLDESHMAMKEFVAPDSMRFRDVVEVLRNWGNCLYVFGLNGNFCGDPMGDMDYLALNATRSFTLTNICEHPGCIEDATRTQKFLPDGVTPVPYTTDINILLDPGDAQYRRVCRSHHIVPGKPGFELSDKCKPLS